MPTAADSFWTYFTGYADSKVGENGFQLFCDATNALSESMGVYLKHAENLQQLMNLSGCHELNYKASSAVDLLRIILRATLNSRLSEFNFGIATTFYKVAFKVYLHVSNEEEITCGGCEFPTENCSCQEIMQTFQEVNYSLLEMGLLERLSGNILMDLIRNRIETHVKETCDGNFETSYVESLENVR